MGLQSQIRLNHWTDLCQLLNSILVYLILCEYNNVRARLKPKKICLGIFCITKIKVTDRLFYFLLNISLNHCFDDQVVKSFEFLPPCFPSQKHTITSGIILVNPCNSLGKYTVLSTVHFNKARVQGLKYWRTKENHDTGNGKGLFFIWGSTVSFWSTDPKYTTGQEGCSSHSEWNSVLPRHLWWEQRATTQASLDGFLRG